MPPEIRDPYAFDRQRLAYLEGRVGLLEKKMDMLRELNGRLMLALRGLEPVGSPQEEPR